jgi:hypothetical protein
MHTACVCVWVCVCVSLGDSRVCMGTSEACHSRGDDIQGRGSGLCLCVCICMCVPVRAYVCVCECVCLREGHTWSNVSPVAAVATDRYCAAMASSTSTILLVWYPKSYRSPHPTPHTQSDQTSVRDFKGNPHADTTAHTSLLSQQQQVPMRCVCTSSTHPQTHTHTGGPLCLGRSK